MRQIEMDGSLDVVPMTEDFKIIIAEHDEPDDLAIERYNLFRKAGTIRVYSAPV
jgi:hypothetical protein